MPGRLFGLSSLISSRILRILSKTFETLLNITVQTTESNKELWGHRPGWTGFRSLITSRKFKKDNNCIYTFNKSPSHLSSLQICSKNWLQGRTCNVLFVFDLQIRMPFPHMYNWTLIGSTSMWHVAEIYPMLIQRKAE